MAEVTHEQVNLLLRLYELRREPKLRQARDWFLAKFTASTPEEMQQQCPPGSEQNAFMRMVISYWDMCANIVNRGLIDEEFFFEHTNEQLVVWEKIKPAIPGARAMYKNPHIMAPLEEHCRRLEAWHEKRSPGYMEGMRKIIAQMSQPAKGAS